MHNIVYCEVLYEHQIGFSQDCNSFSARSIISLGQLIQDEFRQTTFSTVRPDWLSV